MRAAWRVFSSVTTVDERTKTIGERINSISPKEFEVLKTVGGWKISTMRKLNVRTDQELIAFCLESGLFR
ncbi:hypothetical protein [Cupriavidus basilensis]|uniref:hypothetical protein n=1 Tax=Cupriavidus basilensis TaxID=68895 RepID=UPI001ED96E9E|nr:hypothetical protein [Cupriavidus basilensis]